MGVQRSAKPPKFQDRWPFAAVRRDEPLIEVDNLHKWFGSNHVLKGVALQCSVGDVVAVIGPSGSGKSTLLRCLNVLEEPDGGRVLFKGRDITDVRVDLNAVRSRVGIVFQAFNLFPHMTVLDNISLGLRKVLGMSVDEARELAASEAERVGLGGKLQAYPGHLSGGQQQRVAIARALAMQPDAVLFDEVTSALDPELVGEVLEVIRSLAAEHMTMILVTHEMAFAREVASNVIFMDDGRIVERGNASEMFHRPTSERLQRFLSDVL